MTNFLTNRRHILSLAGVTFIGAAALTACSGKSATASASSDSASSTNQQEVTMYVFRGEEGIKGPDGKNHDTFVPASFVVKAGIPVQLTIINTDEGPHTITAADLGLNVMVNPGKTVGNDIQAVTTKATFTPSKKGVFRWYCATQCDGGGDHWAMSKGFDGMSQDGYMAGRIIVI